ncbi:MAG: hypothetical protein KGM99_16365, partial [Burkholderiales bacterium]|nr:hypothetical protein [Burkholderiales bacterium]
MRTYQKILQFWSVRGIYTRLFVPILLLLFAAAGVRYTVLIKTEAGDARQRYQSEMRQIERYVMPALLTLADKGDQVGITQLLQQEVKNNQEIGTLS